MRLIKRGKKGSDPFSALRAALCALALMVAASPAAAMWDGVRWNMSEAEVLRATRGETARAEGWAGRRVKPTRQPALTLKDRLAGERLLGTVRVHAIFWFDPQGRLWSVTEEPAEADSTAADICEQLEAALAARYGERDLSTDKGDQRHLIWRDEPKKTRIHFREGEGGDCTIEYRELRGPLDR
jgi:hypothetical protein